MTTKPTTLISATTAHDREVREYRPVSFAGDSVLEPRMRHGKRVKSKEQVKLYSRIRRKSWTWIATYSRKNFQNLKANTPLDFVML
ncbi:hypothetical protein CUMW_030910 [Citrus unshiu]|nr:hypothetical protein CUMW_030910 [Citrus unshiu]